MKLWRPCSKCYLLLLLLLCLANCQQPTPPTTTPTTSPIPISPQFLTDAILDLADQPALLLSDDARGQVYVAPQGGQTLYTIRQTAIVYSLTLSHPIEQLSLNPLTGYLYAACCPADPRVSIIQDGAVRQVHQLSKYSLDSMIASTGGNVYVSAPRLEKLFIYDAELGPLAVLTVNSGDMWVDPERGWLYVFDHQQERQLVISHTEVISTMPGHGFAGISAHNGYAYFQDCAVINGLEVVATPAAHCFMGVYHIINAQNGLVYRLSPNNDGLSIWQDGLLQIGAHNPDPADFSPTEVPRPGAVNTQSGYVYLGDAGMLPESYVFMYQEAEFIGELLLSSPVRQILADSVRGWAYLACDEQLLVLWQAQIAAELPLAGARLLWIDEGSGLLYYEQAGKLGVIIPPN